MENILKKVQIINEESYNQEIKRSTLLLTKSDYVIKYIMSTFVFINALLAFLVTSKIINIWILVVFYLISGCLLCSCLYLAVKVQILLKGEYFPTGETILNDIKKDIQSSGEIPNPIRLDRDLIRYYSTYTTKLEEANNERATILNQSYKFYLASILFIFSMFFIILIVIA